MRRSTVRMSAYQPTRLSAGAVRKGSFGRVEDGRGSLGHSATLRFPSPLIEPALPISGIRLSDWLHREVHGEQTNRTRLRCGLLRPSTQQSPAAPVIDGVCRLIANHHDLAIFESAPEVRALSSASITRLQRSYGPVRLPPWPPPFATSRPLPSPLTGLPRLPESPFRRAVPTTPAHQTPPRAAFSPAHAAFPF